MSENEHIEQEQDQIPAAASAKSDKAKKDKKPEKKSKPSILARIRRWLHEMKSELKKVQWPTRKQTVNNTLIVIACVIVVGIFIWIFDALASGIVQALINLFH